MIIEHLYLENWGPHKKLDQDFDAHIVGIIGSNGKGKSNLLQAIAYALTGDLDKTRGTAYIRNFGGEDAADKAIVRLNFRVGDKHGSIERVIKANGTTTRKLDWDGETFKAAAEVDRRMREILGADKAAMQNAVYIKQGDIDKLVKGTPAERFDTILKLMNLSFVDSRAENVRKTVFALKSGLKDYTEIWNMLNEQFDQYSNQAKEANALCHKYAGSHNIVEYLSSLNDLLSKRKHIDAELNYNRQKLVKEQAIYTELDSQYGSLDSRLSAIDTYNLEKEKINEILLRVDSLRKLKANRDAVLADISNAKTQLSNTLLTLARLGDIDKIKAEKASLQEQYSRMCEYEKIVADRENLKATVEASLNTYIYWRDKEAAGYADVTNLTNEIVECTKLIAIGDLCTSATNICPVCGGHLEISKLKDILEKHTQYKKQLEELDSRFKLAQKQLEADRVQAQAANVSFTTVNNKLKELSEIKEPEGIYCSSEVLRKRINDQDSILQNIAAEEAKKKMLLEKINNTQVPDAIDIDLSDEEIESYKQKLEVYKKKIADNNEIVEKLEYQARIIELVKETIARLNADYDVVVDTIETTADAAPAGVNPNGSVDYLADLMATHRQGELSYAEAKAALDIALHSIEDTKRKQEEVQADIEKNKKKLQLIDDLQVVMTLTNKSGVPLAYANEVFRSITPDVQNMLEMMQANFTVTPDDDRPLTYKFTRMDNESGYEMQQERLSGGQAIRLSIAILIATQQSILPEVGLLILDEPSSHIDAEGIEHMRDMFMGLDSILENTNMQLICVDHNSVLASAFDKTIEL